MRVPEREVHLLGILPDSREYLKHLEQLESLKVLRIRDTEIPPGVLRGLRRRLRVVDYRLGPAPRWWGLAGQPLRLGE